MAANRVSFSCILDDEDATSRFGAVLGGLLRPGDTVLLKGPIGAGKTHLARSIIQSRMIAKEDVPSPTYTIVQTYRWPECEVWHADLYRIGDSSELTELGLDDALGTAIVLIEWADRLPEEMIPNNALMIELVPRKGQRELKASSADNRWASLKMVFEHV